MYNHLDRQSAIDKIRQGRTQFNQNVNYEEKDNGYKLFINGLEDLVNYQKTEQNQEILKVVKEKILEYFNEAEIMKKQLNEKYPQEKKEGNRTGSEETMEGTTAKPKKQKINSKDEKESTKFLNQLSEAIVQEKPNVKWDDVAGLEQAKKSLQEAVILPIKFPQIFEGSRIPWKGILLYGPPRTGKTYLAKACATECQATLFSISSSDLISKWVGESVKIIKQLFNMAREKKPAIIFIDEIDSIASSFGEGENEASRRVKTEFLEQMLGVGHDDYGILVLGATNFPWKLDPAIRRIFERRIYIPLPEMPARKTLFDILLKKTPNTLKEQEIQILAERTEGFSGSDISVLVKDAAYESWRKCERAKTYKKVYNKDNKIQYTPCSPFDKDAIEMTMLQLKGDQLCLPDVDIDDFLTALSNCKPSISQEDILKQIQFTQKFGQNG